MGTLRTSQLEVLIDGYEWIKVMASLDETALTLAPQGDGFMPMSGEDGFAGGNVPSTAQPGPSSAVWNGEKRFVRVIKPEGHGLGISIQGGADNERPIVISKIFPGMAADQTNQLYMDDVILAVNGESLVNAKHDEAVRALKRAGKVVNLQVQYRKDLHLKRDNVLQRLSWDDEEKMDPRSRQRSFGLKLAYVTRTSLDQEDIENRTIEIRAHSAHHILTLRCANAFEADAWFEAIHACAEQLLIQALAQVNLILGQNPQVRKMGWLAEQGVQEGVLVWRPVFVALTMNDLLFYDSVPGIKQEWACPRITRPLIATRVVQTTSRTFPVITGLSDIISFTTRTGTQEGIRSHLFRVETHRDLSAWVKNIIHYTYEACAEVQQVSAPCVWQDEKCELVVQLEGGISLINSVTQQVIWQHPFEAIRATGDDGQRYLWIDFGPAGGEQEVDLLGSPKAVVFILHSFLATKVHRLGLYA
ncbi:PDZ domain (Also known as DHR or GLGF) domain-containing protein [Ditylenchus destructor]|nr:PDZ domain (Also known as DHR or GLGF) domain-containing protein [Ditylenchus destructor]